MIYYLALFPGLITPDSIHQLWQTFGLYELTNKHPVIHTLLIAAICRTGLALTGSMNGAIACYSAVQLLCCGACFAYALSVLYRLGAQRWPVVLGLLFFTVLPLHGWYAVTMWKDIPFALLMLLLTVRLLLMMRRPEDISVRSWIIFAVLAACFCLMRQSGLIAFVLLVPFLIVRCKECRRAAAVSCSTVLVAVLAAYSVYNIIGIKNSDVVEALSIPEQQIARVFAEGRDVSPEDMALLGRVVDPAQLGERYIEYISNPVKTLLRETGRQQVLSQEPGAYVSLYLRLGLRYPITYLRAYIAQTSGYWYPDVTGRGGFSATTISKNTLGVSSVALLGERLPAMLKDFRELCRMTPLVGLLLSIGTYTYLLLIAFAFARIKRVSIVPFLPALFNLFAILIGTPVANEFRYAYNLIVTAPFLLSATCLLPNADAAPARQEAAQSESPPAQTVQHP